MSRAKHPADIKKHLRRQIWCAIFASDAFCKCKATAEQYLELGLSDTHPLHYTFVSSAVVTYSRLFIQGENMGKLPKDFEKFEDPSLAECHSSVIAARNTIYAHTDATARPYEITIRIRLDNEHYRIGYEAHMPRLRAVILPKMIQLCDRQISVADQMFNKVFAEYLPSKDIGTLLKAERVRETEVKVIWPGK